MTIDNKFSVNFDHKMDRAKEAVFKILGIPTGVNFFKKFLLKKPNNTSTNQSLK